MCIDVKVAKFRVNEKILDLHFNNYTIVQNKIVSHVCLLQVTRINPLNTKRRLLI